MCKTYIMLFVLVMFMVKIKAQTYPFYYYKDSYVELQDNDNRLVIQLNPDMTSLEISDFLTLVANDPNCDMISSTMSIYVMLERKPNNTETKANIISYYINEDYIDYISFIFDHADGGFQAITNHIIVKAHDGITEGEIEDHADDYDLLYMEEDEVISGEYYLFFPKTATYSTLEIANLLFETEDFEFATPDFFRSYVPSGYTSANCTAPSLSDPHFSSQWGVYNSTATSGTNTQWADVNACYAWNYNTGGGIIPVNGLGSGSQAHIIGVQVIDDGIDTRHPDYAYIPNNFTTGADFNYDAIMALPWPCSTSICSTVYADIGCASLGSTHGTHCAGIVGATQNNSIGVSGVAPDANIGSVRIGYFDPGLGGHVTTDLWCIIGLTWKNVFSGVRLCPWTYNGGPSGALDNAINQTTNPTIPYNSTLIFPTGNNNTATISYPGNNPNVITVGAMSMCNERKSTSSCDGITTWGSNYGPSAGPGATGKISVIAPGVNIYTTDVNWGSPPPGYLSNYSGTSAAASFVAGVCAMIKSENYCMSHYDIKNLIEQTADKIGSYSYSFTGANGSWDPEVGYGRINAGNALVWAHDMYRQDEQISLAKTYASPHKIFAGENVDPLGIKNTGNYSVLSGAAVTFSAIDGIDLEPGFEALSGSYFHAQLNTQFQCLNNINSYLKPAKENPSPTKSNRTRAKISNESLQYIRIYPNPVNNELNISFVLVSESMVEFSICNIIGQKVMDATSNTFPKGKSIEKISTKGLISGIYIVTIKSNNGTSQFRFAKE